MSGAAQPERVPSQGGGTRDPGPGGSPSLARYAIHTYISFLLVETFSYDARMTCEGRIFAPRGITAGPGGPGSRSHVTRVNALVQLRDQADKARNPLRDIHTQFAPRRGGGVVSRAPHPHVNSDPSTPRPIGAVE
jgi:hypothetical protein